MMAKEKTYFEEFYGYCPKCNSDEVFDAGESQAGNQILRCSNCNLIFLESDIIVTLQNRKERDEDGKRDKMGKQKD